MPHRPAITAILLLFTGTASATADQPESFAIRVIDEDTGRGVPLVELTTVNNIRSYTDSAGIVAFAEPGLMNHSVFFKVSSHGYEFPKDGFGFRGARLNVKPGGSATLKIKRINIAERLYRVTGAGIYRDSQLTGRPVPTAHPLLNARVMGSDSVVNAVYRGQLYWFWGDTNRPSYPLGNFHVPGAVSKLPGQGGLDPNIGVNLKYFTDSRGFAKPTAKMPGDGPTWISGLVVVTDARGRERMFASYVKIKPPLTIYERGLCEFDDESQEFRRVTSFDLKSPLFPTGHPFRHRTGDVEYVYFGNPFPVVRVRATPAALRNLSQYEAWTCFAGGSQTDKSDLQRADDGSLAFSWQRNTIPFTPKLQAHLVKQKRIQASEGLYRLSDAAGRPVLIHGGSVRWNAYRKKWIMVAVESFGTSPLGEVWYAESANLTGPWSNATKIVTHDKYSFYNPKQHEMFDQSGGRVIYFEGTYTSMFSGNPDQTPRYDYNQVMYKLDLSDPRISK